MSRMVSCLSPHLQLLFEFLWTGISVQSSRVCAGGGTEWRRAVPGPCMLSLRLIGQVYTRKSTPPPLLISSLVLEHMLNFKSFLSWAPSHDAACQTSACADVLLPDVLLGTSRSCLSPGQAALFWGRSHVMLRIRQYVTTTYMSFLLVFLPSRLQHWYLQQRWQQVRGLALLLCHTAHAALVCRAPVVIAS